MAIEKNRPELLDGQSGKSIYIRLEDKLLVARRNGHFDEKTELQLNLSYVSGLSDKMSRAVIGLQLLDFILEWIQEDKEE